jgi:hypothetical protein
MYVEMSQSVTFYRIVINKRHSQLSYLDKFNVYTNCMFLLKSSLGAGLAQAV